MAGFISERVAGFKLECLAGFVGIRRFSVSFAAGIIKKSVKKGEFDSGYRGDPSGLPGFFGPRLA
jgi:hypothetical protein